MKKILFITCFALSANIGCAQTSFEGEIDYKMFTFNDVKTDTSLGEPLKLLVGGHAVKLERFTRDGILLEELIVRPDSLEEFDIDVRTKTYQVWKPQRNRKAINSLPWGMDKVNVNADGDKICDYKTYTILLSDNKHPSLGYIELSATKDIFFQVPFYVTNGFMSGLVFFDNRIMLKIKIVAGEKPHSQIDYLATKIEVKDIDPQEFKIPREYRLITAKPPIFR